MRTQLLGATFLLAATTALGQPPERVRVLVGFPAVPGRAEENLIRAAGGEIRYRYHLVPAVAATVPVTALDGLRRNPRVSVVEPDGLVRAIDAELDNTWGVKRIGSAVVHDGGNRGDGVKVAIVDTGIDPTHPDLDDNYMGGIDLVNDDTDPSDDHSHGTHVAGTVAGEDNGVGVVGVAPKALLYGAKVLSASGNGFWSDIIAAIEWAADNGIQITNNSYGASADPGSLVRAAFDNSYAAGVFHVAAAGNSGTCSGTGDNVGYPAKFDSVVAVAATNSSDDRACFSSTGPDVELAAPGVQINSTRLGGGYVTYSGTSMASPHVAGTAALVIASGTTAPAHVRQRLVDTAFDLGSPGRDDLYGFGLVDAAEAAEPGGEPVNQAPAVTITSPGDGAQFDSGTTIVFEGIADDLEDGDLTAGLDWVSNVDGPIGAGGSFNAVLSGGIHTVTATATDSVGQAGSDSVTVTVTAATADTVTLTSISYSGHGGRNGNKHLDVVATVANDLGNPVGGASVTLLLYSNGSSVGLLSGVTDGGGRASMTLRHAPGGCYTSDAVSVTASGFVWDGTTPPNGSCN